MNMSRKGQEISSYVFALERLIKVLIGNAAHVSRKELLIIKLLSTEALPTYLGYGIFLILSIMYFVWTESIKTYSSNVFASELRQARGIQNAVHMSRKELYKCEARDTQL